MRARGSPGRGGRCRARPGARCGAWAAASGERRLPSAGGGRAPCALPGAPAAGGAEAPGGTAGRWSGAAGERLRSGRGASTAPPRPVLLAGAAGPAPWRCPPEQRLQRRPQAEGSSRGVEPPPARRHCRSAALPGPAGCAALPDRRLWQSLTGQHLPVGASSGVPSQLPALRAGVVVLWKGCALLGALGTADAGKRKQTNSICLES